MSKSYHVDENIHLNNSDCLSHATDAESVLSDIYQLDGNMSLNSSVLSDKSGDKIQVVIGNRSDGNTFGFRNRIPIRKTLRRDNRGELSLYLPNIAVYNHRSFWKKQKNF